MAKILIVEDDVISRKYLSKFLNRYGHCDLVVDGYEAIDAFILAIQEKSPYELICLDIMMPKVDGIQVLEAIRKIEASEKISKVVKIVMTTALGRTDMVRQAFDLGCDAYASKPIDIEKFVEVLSQLGFEPL